MKEISVIAKSVKPSPIRKMFNLASTMDNVINFSVGEPDFITPAHIIQAAKAALDRGETHYTPNAGIVPLRKAIATATEKSHGLYYDFASEIIVTAGGMEALYLCMLTLLDPGDEVIISNPYWTNYPSQVQMAGAVPVFVPVREENGFVFDARDVREAITPRTKAIIINSPSNPTGGVAGKTELEALAELAREKDLYVISDEVYCNLLYNDVEFVSIASLQNMKERTIIVNSFSKTYAMTGWRVGYALGPAQIITNMVKLQENVAACVNTAAQFGALEALTGTQEPLHEMQREYAARRELVISKVKEIDGLSCISPKGAFYAFINVSATGMSAEEFAYKLLEKEHVVVVPGTGFGDRGCDYIRISYATSRENIGIGFDRISRFVKSLQP